MINLKKHFITLLLTVTVASLGMFFSTAIKADASAKASISATVYDSSAKSSLNIGVMSEENSKNSVKEISSDVTEKSEDSSSISDSSSEPESSSSSSSASSQPQKEVKVTVGKPTSLTTTALEKTSAKLSWKKASNADGYIIYIKNLDGDKTLTRVGKTTKNAFTVKNLKHTTYYQFVVQPYKIANGKKYVGNTATFKTVTKPADVSSLKLARSSSVIKFTWKQNSKATGYEVFRMYSSTNNKYIKYKTLGKYTLNTLQDTKVKKGEPYYYRVRSYRKVGNKVYYGAFSTIYAVSGLSAPSIKSLTSQINKIMVSWSKNAIADGYDIFLAKADTTDYKLIGSTKNTYFNTDKYKTGVDYKVRVVPYKYVGKDKTRIMGSTVTKQIKVNNLAYNTNVGTTYIEVSIDEQKMWFYVNGKKYVETPVVTGMKNGYNDTPKGAYKIFQRQSPATLVGANYVTQVNYWLGFTYYGVGIHDATWRAGYEYGGDTYTYNGSHGCVNTPYDAVKKIYEKARVGMYVVVH